MKIGTNVHVSLTVTNDNSGDLLTFWTLATQSTAVPWYSLRLSLGGGGDYVVSLTQDHCFLCCKNIFQFQRSLVITALWKNIDEPLTLCSKDQKHMGDSLVWGYQDAKLQPNFFHELQTVDLIKEAFYICIYYRTDTNNTILQKRPCCYG